MIIFKIWIFNLSDINQGIHEHAIENKLEFLAFWKKLLGEKEKNPILVYPGLRYAHKALNLAWKKMKNV